MSSERFLAVLQSEGPLCDDCIYVPAGLAQRQSANQLRRLQGLGVIARGSGTCPKCLGTKTINRFLGDSTVLGASLPVAPSASRVRGHREWHVTSAQFEECVHDFVDGTNDSHGRQPDERYASFDYCFNYFQSFRDAGEASSLGSSANIQVSCLQLGFYLASWGMLRGSSHLLQRSARFLAPVVELISATESGFWEIDANNYDDSAIRRLLDMGSKIGQAIGSKSDTLVTKVMLGVFGCVPAFDRNFKLGFEVSAFGPNALNKVADFYEDHAKLIDGCRVPTLDFVTGEPTVRLYTRAKVIDMAFFIRGVS